MPTDSAASGLAALPERSFATPSPPNVLAPKGGRLVSLSIRLANRLLLVPPVRWLNRQLAPTIDRGSLSEADALAGLIRYGAMGLVGTFVYLLVALALNSQGTGPTVTSIGAVVISVLTSYVVQSRVTFQADRLRASEAIRFTAIALVGMALSRSTIELVHLRGGRPFWLAVAIVCGIVPVVNFAMMNFWVFASKGQPESSDLQEREGTQR